MTRARYHHGNLRQELILAGIQIVNQEGMQNLSLRKAAALCGVSHAAPKSHFEDKEAFEEAMKSYVALEFTRYLERVIQENVEPKELIRDMGRAFVRFFYDHPQCFHLINSQKDIDIRIGADGIQDSNYPPFQIFQETARGILNQNGLDAKEQAKEILRLWAQVTGLAGICSMEGFHYQGDWMEMVYQIIA